MSQIFVCFEWQSGLWSSVPSFFLSFIFIHRSSTKSRRLNILFHWSLHHNFAFINQKLRCWWYLRASEHKIWGITDDSKNYPQGKHVDPTALTAIIHVQATKKVITFLCLNDYLKGLLLCIVIAAIDIIAPLVTPKWYWDNFQIL